MSGANTVSPSIRSTLVLQVSMSHVGEAPPRRTVGQEVPWTCLCVAHLHELPTTTNREPPSWTVALQATRLALFKQSPYAINPEKHRTFRGVPILGSAAALICARGAIGG